MNSPSGDASEHSIKRERVRALLTRLGYDTLILTRRSNFAWYTCGGEAVSSRVSPTSPVYLVITPDYLYAVGYSMDLPSALDHALHPLEVQPVSVQPFGKSLEQTALDLAVGRIATDAQHLGIADIQTHLVLCHEPFTAPEMIRYRQAAQAAAQIHKALAAWVEPGMTEHQVMTRMWSLTLERGLEGHFMFVGADDNIQKYRHCVPTDNRIENCVLIAPALARNGLLVTSSRLIYFKPPSADIRQRFQAVAGIQAALIANTQPGTPLKALFDLLWAQFEEQGYPEDRYRHFHGGPIGYWDSYVSRMQDPAQVVSPNMAFSYYLTITGVKSEELMLVDDHGASLVSVDDDWPLLSIEVDKRVIGVPDILVRS